MKWGILATGNIAQKFASTLKQMEGEGEVLTAAGSRRAESAAAFGAAYGIPHTHGSYEALAADPEVEAVYIATPNSLHAADVRAVPGTRQARAVRKAFHPDGGPGPGSSTPLAAEKGLFLMEALWIRFFAAVRRAAADAGRRRHWGSAAGLLPVRICGPGRQAGEEVPFGAGRWRAAGYRRVQPGIFPDGAGGIPDQVEDAGGPLHRVWHRRLQQAVPALAERLRGPVGADPSGRSWSAAPCWKAPRAASCCPTSSTRRRCSCRGGAGEKELALPLCDQRL